MKQYISLISFVAFIIAFSACEEVPPPIDLQAPVVGDTSYVSTDVPSPQEKKVVVEEFSGIRCVNCPAGNAYIVDVSDQNPGKVISMTLHASEFANPLPFSNESFETEETKFLSEFLNVRGYPSASVDRLVYAGQDDISMLAPYSNWGIAIDERLATSPKVNIELSAEYDASDRSIRVQTDMIYTESVPGTHHLSVFLLENGIIDPQQTSDTENHPTGIIMSYEHNHVVRKMLTVSQGIPLPNDGMDAGWTIVRILEDNLDEAWVAENCEIVAVVHQTGDSKEVLQGAKVKLMP